MRALIVSGDEFEDTELLVPWYRLREAGVAADIASLRAGKITGKHGYVVEADKGLEAIDPADYGLLVLPGGRAPARLRNEKPLHAIVRSFFISNRPVAAICHGPQILVSSGVLSGRTATCYRKMAHELTAAGCRYLDREVVVDGPLITSRVPDDLPAFCREMMKKIEPGSRQR